MDLSTAVRALASGEAFVDVSHWRTVSVAGPDAAAWLNDLVSADIGELRPGEARGSLLLSPTGRIRAGFTVAAVGRGQAPLYLLVQDPTQPSPVDALLAPYVLSSTVELRDRTGELAVFAIPGRDEAPEVPGASASSPSCVGAGVDLVASAGDHSMVVRALGALGIAPVPPEAQEAWRATAGIPRVGVDALPDDLPQEAGLAAAVAFDKGCYLGQEAVAKVRNLGHPRRVLAHLLAEGPVRAGEGTVADGRTAGEVTSAWSDDGRSWLLARVRWEAREGPFATTSGVELTPAGPAGGG